jgi:hypothetical protein
MKLIYFIEMFEKKKPKEQKLVHDKVRTLLTFKEIVETLITDMNSYLIPSFG